MTTCAPPNGSFLRPLAIPIAREMASIKSALTIETSSMINTSNAARTSRVLLFMCRARSCSARIPKGNPKSE